MQDKTKISILFILLIIVFMAYMFTGIKGSLDYVLPRRFNKALAMAVVGIAIAYSSVIFQTVSFNRILTPGIMGFDSVYLFIQTLAVYFHSSSFLVKNHIANFFLSIVCLLGFVWILYRLVFRKDGNIFFLMLVGVVLGTLFKSLATFMQMLIDPNEFAIVQDKMFASFNNIAYNLMGIAIPVLLAIILAGARYLKYLDVMLLGREHAINLGVDYTRTVRFVIIIVTVLTAVSTAFVGPITFLGLLVSNLAYELCKTYKHAVIIPAACLISAVALIGGQLLIERVFYFNITISVVINFTGGIYFMYLLLKENSYAKG